MDPNRFDDWSRSLARRFSRRQMVGSAAALGGATLAPSATAAQFGGQNCQFQVRASIAAGPSAGANLEGTLEFTVDADGAITAGSMTPVGSTAMEVRGSARGRALDLVVSLPDNKELSFSGAVALLGDSCTGPAAGVFAGPEPGDLGAWRAETA
ncbi:MAG: hypothetical protein KF883_00070 [Thermomicrobiales bacterium]|nr:hypothetical protein [Thermomicrobiales bacterium]